MLIEEIIFLQFIINSSRLSSIANFESTKAVKVPTREMIFSMFIKRKERKFASKEESGLMEIMSGYIVSRFIDISIFCQKHLGKTSRRESNRVFHESQRIYCCSS